MLDTVTLVVGSDKETSRSSQALAELGSALGCGLLAALLGSGPAALRLSSSDGGDRAWLVLAACATPFAAIAVGVLRETYAGLGALMGQQRSVLRVFVSAWLLTSAPVLFALGALLREKTHHRPLAGATFALVGLAVLLGTAAFSRRVALTIEKLREPMPRLREAAAAIVHVAVVALVLYGARKLHAKLPVESAATMVDVTALGLACALAARPELRPFRLLAVVGPVAAVGVVVLGMTQTRPDFVALASERAPAFAILLSVLP